MEEHRHAYHRHGETPARTNTICAGTAEQSKEQGSHPEVGDAKGSGTGWGLPARAKRKTERRSKSPESHPKSSQRFCAAGGLGDRATGKALSHATLEGLHTASGTLQKSTQMCSAMPGNTVHTCGLRKTRLTFLNSVLLPFPLKSQRQIKIKKLIFQSSHQFFDQKCRCGIFFLKHQNKLTSAVPLQR